MKLALISMPWSLFNRPSVQLGTLKAYLENQGEFSVDCFHPYLGAAKLLTPKIYQYLSRNSWAGEALYAAQVFPQRRSEAEKVFRQSCRDNPAVSHNFSLFSRQLQDHLESWIQANSFNSYDLVGFTVCFSQLFSSLAAAQQIKNQPSPPPIVFGGSSIVGSLGITLQSQFEQIDYIITGEGEKQIKMLCEQIGPGKSLSRSEPADRLLSAHSKDMAVAQLDSLPTPDYRPYFSELAQQFPDQPFAPVLPIEFSRGCWWNECTFCNLNLQWSGYRRKSSEKMLSEIEELLQRHQCLDFTFCDNVLPPAETGKLFTAVEQWRRDVRFFAEIRKIDDPQKLKKYRRGGLTTVQVGIESFSNSLLERMNKGTSVIENLAVMKHCAENGITLDGNLILEFPGSTEAEVDETLNTIDFALPFHPLSGASFFLGTGSPVERQPQQYGIRAVTCHRNNRLLFPKEVAAKLDMLIKDYRGDKIVQKRRWQRVRKRIRQWQEFHAGRNSSTGQPLSYRDGGTFLIIRQERENGPPLLHRLRGSSRRLYLFCSSIRSMEEISSQFPELSQKSILNFFGDLSKKHLLYHENSRFLALAVHTP